MVALPSPSTTAGSRPSPSWASTLSVPITPLASLAHMYWASLVSRAPPSTATRSGSAAPRAWATRSMASPHPASRKSGPPAADASLISGAGRRSELLRASKPKRSLSDSQPQLTAPASAPSTRSTRLRDACTATLAPTLSTHAVDTVSLRSHGLALKR